MEKIKINFPPIFLALTIFLLSILAIPQNNKKYGVDLNPRIFSKTTMDDGLESEAKLICIQWGREATKLLLLLLLYRGIGAVDDTRTLHEPDGFFQR
jgi:hypothetical protein